MTEEKYYEVKTDYGRIYFQTDINGRLKVFNHPDAKHAFHFAIFSTTKKKILRQSRESQLAEK